MQKNVHCRFCDQAWWAIHILLCWVKASSNLLFAGSFFQSALTSIRAFMVEEDRICVCDMISTYEIVRNYSLLEE